MQTEPITIFTGSTFVSSSNEVERIAQAIEAWPECNCEEFCECYGRNSFKLLSDYIRANFMNHLERVA